MQPKHPRAHTGHLGVTLRLDIYAPDGPVFRRRVRCFREYSCINLISQVGRLEPINQYGTSLIRIPVRCLVRRNCTRNSNMGQGERSNFHPDQLSCPQNSGSIDLTHRLVRRFLHHPHRQLSKRSPYICDRA
jgi:hypothetical protein